MWRKVGVGRSKVIDQIVGADDAIDIQQHAREAEDGVDRHAGAGAHLFGEGVERAMEERVPIQHGQNRAGGGIAGAVWRRDLRL